MKRIAIDMDEVIADFHAEQLVRFNYKFNKNLTSKDVQGIKLQKLMPHLEKEIDDLINQDSFFRNLKVIENSQIVIEKLSFKYEIFIASAAMDHTNSFDAKLKWLDVNFPFIKRSNIVFCGDKSIVKADYLIDDHTHHFANFSGQGILFTSPHNINETDYPRMDNWKDVENYFLGDI